MTDLASRPRWPLAAARGLAAQALRALTLLTWPLAWACVLLIRAYQLLVSPLLGPCCRFYPSCSAYAVEALLVHGLPRGGSLAAWRLLRCHPWNPGGVDRVPPRSHAATAVRAVRPDPHLTQGA